VQQVSGLLIRCQAVETYKNENSFDNLPNAVAHLLGEVAEIKILVEKRNEYTFG